MSIAFQLGKKDKHRYRDALIFYSQALDALAGFDPWGNPIGPSKSVVTTATPTSDAPTTVTAAPSVATTTTTTSDSNNLEAKGEFSKEKKMESVLLSNRALVHLTMGTHTHTHTRAYNIVSLDISIMYRHL
jgi:hypothetical protein